MAYSRDFSVYLGQLLFDVLFVPSVSDDLYVQGIDYCIGLYGRGAYFAIGPESGVLVLRHVSSRGRNLWIGLFKFIVAVHVREAATRSHRRGAGGRLVVWEVERSSILGDWIVGSWDDLGGWTFRLVSPCVLWQYFGFSAGLFCLVSLSGQV